MRFNPAYRKITADEFLVVGFGTDKRFKLADRVIVMMAGGTEPHAWVQRNIYARLRQHLRGTGGRPYGPDMAIQISDTGIRHPDGSIHYGPPSREQLTDATKLPDPAVIIEVLSPSRTTLDQATKLEEYKRLSSVRTIAFVDPTDEMCRTVERRSKIGRLDHIFSALRGIIISSLNLTIPHPEIFARD